jgi:hypothetical protein
MSSSCAAKIIIGRVMSRTAGVEGVAAVSRSKSYADHSLEITKKASGNPLALLKMETVNHFLGLVISGKLTTIQICTVGFFLVAYA